MYDVQNQSSSSKNNTDLTVLEFGMLFASCCHVNAVTLRTSLKSQMRFTHYIIEYRNVTGMASPPVRRYACCRLIGVYECVCVCVSHLL